MVCRQSPLGSAMSTLARGNSGLEDNQCLSLMHALMREGSDEPAPTSAQWNTFIDGVISDIRSGAYIVPPRSRGLLERLEAARSETPEGPRFYAIQRIMRRSNAASEGHVSWLSHQAGVRGSSGNAIVQEFQEHFDAATANSSLRPSSAFRTAFLADPANAGTLTDNRSLYAYEQISQRTEQAAAARPSRPAVQRTAVNSAAVAELGYDRVTGRVEVVMRSNPDRIYAYRMSPAEFEEFANAPSVGSYYARRVRSNPDFQYGTADESASAADVRQCPTCRQFMGADHACPAVGSEEAINRDLRRATEQQRYGRVLANEPARLPRTRRQYQYYVDPQQTLEVSLTAPTLSRVRQESRRNPSVLVPILGNVSDETGRFTVSGNALVEYQGRGAGYAASAVTAPGDTGRDQLRCTCPQYRREYRCPHIAGAIDALNAGLNGSDAPTRSNVAAAATTVTNGLASEYEASLATTSANAENWVPLSTSLTENPEAFQEIYEEFRQKRTAYREALQNGETAEYPVPYIPENALGGLATRASGRGFGAEIEFSFPPGTSFEDRRDAIRRIGQELYDLGLTRSTSQMPYGDSHGWTRDMHERGWAFEEDPSTGDFWGDESNAPGGEIIAPIMYDEPESWENIQKVCEVLKRNGAVASKNAGLHVHVSVGDYDHRVENHNRLLAAVAENEDLLYRMSSNPERGSHRGRYYCSPNNIPSSPYRSVSNAAQGQYGHSLAINLQSVTGRSSDHVEFRTFDSSLEPAVIQSQIAMSVYMAEGATRPGTGDLEATSRRHPLGERHAANPRRQALSGDDWLAATEPIRSFADRFVPGGGHPAKQNPQLRQIIALFAVTRWQSNSSRR